jgi:hypothetical protein
MGCPSTTNLLLFLQKQNLVNSAGLGGHIVPRRDGGRRHAQMCWANGVEGAPGCGAVKMEP